MSIMMMSSTSMTSTSGVTLMSRLDGSAFWTPPTSIAIAVTVRYLHCYAVFLMK